MDYPNDRWVVLSWERSPLYYVTEVFREPDWPRARERMRELGIAWVTIWGTSARGETYRSGVLRAGVAS